MHIQALYKNHEGKIPPNTLDVHVHHFKITTAPILARLSSKSHNIAASIVATRFLDSTRITDQTSMVSFYSNWRLFLIRITFL